MEGSTIDTEQEIDFVTLGMFIIDEIHHPPPTPPSLNIIGGAGTYSALGARLLSPPPLSRTIGWIVDAGSDFPSNLTALINSWDSSCLLRRDDGRLTTRGWNGYTPGTEYREFKYTTPKLRLEAKDLLASPALLASKSFHLICSPSRCISLVRNILHLRAKHLPPPLHDLSALPPKPLFIWEPVPDLCTSDELLNVTAALGYVDVMSPNHAELGQLMGCSGEDADGNVDRSFVEEAAEVLLGSMPLSSVAVVVRCGKDGCYVAQNGGRTEAKEKKREEGGKPKKIRGGGLALTADVDLFSLLSGLSVRDDESEDEDEDSTQNDEVSKRGNRDFGISAWLPAYHTSSEKVVDPTGGGNAFLGGLAVGMARDKGLEEAAMWGTVAASFAIEQVGVPELDEKVKKERWNDATVHDRLKELEDRVRGGKS